MPPLLRQPWTTPPWILSMAFASLPRLLVCATPRKVMFRFSHNSIRLFRTGLISLSWFTFFSPQMPVMGSHTMRAMSGCLPNRVSRAGKSSSNERQRLILVPSGQ